jgi:hypothetical protein
MKKLFFLILLTYQTCYSLPIDTNVVKYYPLAIGNSWTYSYLNYPYGPIYRYREMVTGTISTNSHFYYIITTYRIGYPVTIVYRRIDSVKNNILIYNTNGCAWLQNEIAGDSIGARLGDSSKYFCTDN